MSNTPQVYGPDGILRDEVVFSTTVLTRFFTGVLPLETIEVQVSINGSGFSSDETQVQWGDGTWVIPNPAYEPAGLLLLEGENTVEVRAILPSGTITGRAKATARLATDADLGVVVVAPTNISVEQLNNAVTIKSEAPDDTSFQGMNFYASAYAGGGITGYTRINVERVAEGVITTETSEFAVGTAKFAVKADANGVPVADPLYLRLTASQEDADKVLIQSDLNERYEVPEEAKTLQLKSTLSQVREVAVYGFTHNRRSGPTSSPSTVRVSSFANMGSSDPLFYVVTAVFYDSAQALEYESAFSPEVVGTPELVTTALGSIPAVSRQNIIREFMTAIFRSNPQIKVEVGSVLRDTVIDPFSSESERVRFLLDFYHRARTPTLLLQIDDPNSEGISVPVASSPYKLGLQSALYMDSAQTVQDLIDSAFGAYASNFGILRRTGAASQGEVLFYSARKPSSSLVIPMGTVVSGGGVSFTTTRESTISTATIARYYNPVTGNYQISVPVTASTTGSRTNVGIGQVRAIESSLSGSFNVTNLAAMVGGQDSESNLALTARVQNRLASVDSGTARGYLQTAADVPGVIKANVVASGDPLMQRDLDDSGVHKGGKVDVWIQGSNAVTVTDTFAFTFEIAQDVQFEVVGSATGYTFRALDTTLSESDPIVEMLDDPTVGYEFRNASTGEVFDLTGVTITSYSTIQLDTAILQPPVDLTDVLLGSYRRRVGSVFTLLRQPVSAITSVVGTVAGTLPTTAYLLVHPDAPLGIGRSSLATDYLQIDGYTDDSGTLIPSGDTITITGETHVLVGQYPEFLDNLGANYLTIVVMSSDGLITYAGPNDPSGTPDYTISLGTQTTAVSITRTGSSTIANGATVLLSYSHDENFTATYTTNLIVALTQNAVDAQKHVTADVIVKESVAVPMDIESTILLVRGRDQSTVDTSLRTNLANFFGNLRLGDPVRQSDIIDVMEQTDGVSYVVVPLTKMVRQEGSTVVREVISTDTVTESILVGSLTTNTAVVYLLTEELSAATTDGGGPVGTFRSVFQDDVSLTLLDQGSTLASLGAAIGYAYILGSEGRSIDGISDDVTLYAQGYVTTAAAEARRIELTANRILVSVKAGDSPVSHTYAATYIVGSDTGAKNIDPDEAEYCSEGSFVLTYDEDR